MDAKQAREILRNVFTGAAIRPQDMLRSCKGILGSLPLVANALVQASGKRVNVVHGAVALGATDGNTIALMNLPIPRDDSDIDTFVLMLALAYGLIHHEVGHVNHSTFTTIGRAQATGSELVMHLRGIIEDVRQENVHIRRFPAAKPYLDALNAALQVTGHFAPVTAQVPSIQAFTGYLLYRLYRDYRGDATVNDMVEPAEQVIKQMFPADVLIRLETLLPRMRQLEDSDDALELAIDIESMLKDEIKNAQQQQQAQSQQQGNGQPQPGNSNAQAGGAPGQQDASNPSTSAPGKSQSAKGKGKKKSGSKDGSAANGPGGSGAGGSTPDLQQLICNLQSTLDGTKAKDAYGDKGQSIAQALQQLVQEIQKDGAQGLVEMTNDALQRELDEPSNNAPRRNSPYDMAQALSVTGHLRVKLIRELQAQTELDIRVGKRGRRISSRHLHRICANDPRVFRTVDEEQDLNTGVALMIDVSGSMADVVDPNAGTRVIEVASKALYATAVAMESLDGVDVAVGTFPFFDVVKPFKTRARRIDGSFSLDAAGGTPMAQGVQLGVRLLKACDKHRKILIVITDGAPNSRAEAQLAILAAGREGIEVYGLGICTAAGEDIFDRWDVIHEVAELPAKLMGLLRSRMLRAA